ncbi:hypothetical protein GCM10028895_34800 [Pontibacter rugosus]
MERDYTAQAEALSTEDLKEVVQQHQEYEPEAVQAAMAALEKRGEEVPEWEPAEQAQPQRETLGQKINGFLQLFVPQQNYFVTPILLNLNLLVFIVGALLGLHVLEPDAARLVDLGANFGPYTLTGQPWRLLTSMFLHGGLLHLLFNMMALVNIGAQLEMLIGRVQFILAYVLCGLAGSVISLWWVSPEVNVSVGASGAIFGMFGLLLMVLLLEREMDWKTKQGMLGSMAVVIGLNLAYGMRDGIDNAAHVGGLVTGVVYGALLLLRSDRYITQKYSAVGNSITMVTGLLLVYVWFSLIPFTGKTRYVQVVEKIGQNEQQAMQAMIAMDKAGENVKAEEMVPMLANGIALWEESENLLESIDDAPDAEKPRVAAMLDYVRLRKMSYQMLHDDLLANRPLLHQKQQQMLGAINHYAMQLQHDNFSEAASPVITNDYELEQKIKGSDGKPWAKQTLLQLATLSMC